MNHDIRIDIGKGRYQTIIKILNSKDR